jgi:hypothetical protein
MRFRQRLDVEHVERRAGDRMRLERRDQRGFIDDRAARGVDRNVVGVSPTTSKERTSSLVIKRGRVRTSAKTPVAVF